MDRYEIREKVAHLIEPYLKARGLELFEVTYHFEGDSIVLRLLVDEPQGGITVDAISDLNFRIGTLLDEADILPGRYLLEVSSPGADRPLVQQKDFIRCLNRTVRVYLREPLEGTWEIEGVVARVDEASFECDRDGEKIAIPFSQIAKAKQVIP